MEKPKDDWFNICKVQQTTTSSRMRKEFCKKNTVRLFISAKTKSRYSSAQQPCWIYENEKVLDCCMGGIERDIIVWTAHDVLNLGNLTQENIQHEDHYLIKVVLAGTNKAISNGAKRTPPLWDTGCTRSKRYMIWKDSHMFREFRESAFHDKQDCLLKPSQRNYTT